MKKIDKFTRVAHRLLTIGASPLLYGSLGLSLLVSKPIDADDIDVLIEEQYLKEKWPLLLDVMEEEGFYLLDLKEHAFTDGEDVLAFASREELATFITLGEGDLLMKEGYQLLSLKAYEQVYLKALEDSYRQDKKKGQDQKRLALIKEERYGQ